MKAEHQARLEPRRNRGYVSTGICGCAAVCGMHRVRGQQCPNGGGSGRRKGARSCFAACVLLCNLVAALHP